MIVEWPVIVTVMWLFHLPVQNWKRYLHRFRYLQSDFETPCLNNPSPICKWTQTMNTSSHQASSCSLLSKPLLLTTTLAMEEHQVTGSVQYAFGPDGALVTGPVLMDDPATGKIICASCQIPKAEHSFFTIPPYNFKSQFCLDCERVSCSCE